MSFPSSAPEMVFFAIQSAIKLGGNMRQAYINNLQSKELTLPLPAVNLDTNLMQITAFFQQRPQLAAENPALGELLRKESDGVLSPAEERRYRAFFEAAFMAENQDPDASIQGDDIVSLVTFRQWANEADAPITGLRLVAGTLVEIGVDYFAQSPGLLRGRLAKPLEGVMQALDAIDLTSREGQAQAMRQVGPQLFAAALDNAPHFLPELTSDPQWQRVVQASCQGVASDLCRRLEGLSTASERQSAQQWGAAVFQSLLRHAGPALMAEARPGAPEGQFLQQAGISVMQALLDEDLQGMRLKDVMAGPVLDAFLRTGIEGLAQHPEWAGQHELLGSILSDTARAVLASGFQRQRLIPDLARVALQQTAAHLPQLMSFQPDRPHAVLVAAAQELLQALASQEPDAQGHWRPGLSNEQVLQLGQAMLAQVASNPQWMAKPNGGKSLLGEVLSTSLQAMQGIPEERRLSGEALQQVLLHSVQAVAANRLLLQALPLPNGKSAPALGYALQAMFAHLYGDAGRASEQWALAKGEAVSALVGELLSKLAGQPITASFIDQTISLQFGGVENRLVQAFMRSLDGIDLGQGLRTAFFRQVAPSLAQDALQAVGQAAPSLLHDPGFQQVVAHTADALGRSLAAQLQDAADGPTQEAWGQWGRSLASTLASEAGMMALEASIDFFGADEAEAQLVARVGEALVGLAAQGGLRQVLKGDSLQQLAQICLHTASEYPEVFGKHDALRQALAGLAGSVAAAGIDRPNMVPELLRMALIQAQGQLQLIWNPQSPQGSVLAITLQHSLSVLAAPAPAGRWKPTFTQAQLLELAQLAMAEAAQHPAWASDQADGKPLLAFAWQQALHGMAKVPAGQWLSPATVQLVMHQTLKAVGMRRQLLDRLPSAEQETVLSYALDSLLGYLFHAEDSSVRWAATKSKVLHLLIEHVLHKAAIGPADTGTIDGIMGKLREQLAKISDNETFDSVVFLQELLMG